MADEIIFEVRDANAVRAEQIGLEDAGLKEREHLQEWVVANPDVLGEDVMVVTIEFGTWTTYKGSSERDRLDVLGLSSDGRLLVAELKRGAAPDTVEMQALKYAAMASRFNLDQLGEAHAAFLKSRGEVVSDSEALERLNNHTGFTMDSETLRTPRIVLLASSFPAPVTATAVWLSEMGIDIALKQFQAYRLGERIMVSVSNLYPVRDVEEFTVAPTRSGRKSAAKPELPEVPWVKADIDRFADVVSNPTVIAAMNLCSERPGDWIALRDIEARGGRTRYEARADLAGLTMMVKSRFERSNWPFEFSWAAGGEEQVYYRMDPEVATYWIEATQDDSPGEIPGSEAPQ